MTTGCAPSVSDSCSHGAWAWLSPWTPIGRIDGFSGSEVTFMTSLLWRCHVVFPCELRTDQFSWGLCQRQCPFLIICLLWAKSQLHFKHFWIKTCMCNSNSYISWVHSNVQTLSTWNLYLCLSGGLQFQESTGCFITVSMLSVQSFTLYSSVKHSPNWWRKKRSERV